MLRSCKVIEDETAAKDRHVAAIRNERNRLKSVGFGRSEVDFALQLLKSKSPEADVDEWRKRQRVAFFLSHPIGTQIDLFDGKLHANREPIEEVAFKAGFEAGSTGKGQKDNPHDLSTAAGQAWLRGWHEAQDIIAKRFKPLNDTVPPSSEAGSTGGDGSTLIKGAPAESEPASDPKKQADGFDDALADAGPEAETEGQAEGDTERGETGSDKPAADDGKVVSFSEQLRKNTVEPGEALMKANRNGGQE